MHHAEGFADEIVYHQHGVACAAGDAVDFDAQHLCHGLGSMKVVFAADNADGGLGELISNNIKY